MLTGNGHAKTTLSWSPKGATAATAVTLWLRWEPWGEVFALVRWLIRSTQIWKPQVNFHCLDEFAAFEPLRCDSCLDTPQRYKLQLVFLSVSCRLLSRNSVQTSKDMSLEPVEFFRHICFPSAWKNLTFYQYRQGNLVKLCIFWVEPPFLHEGSFQLERCTTQGVVSVGRYQTEPRWFSSCVKSYVGTLSLEPSDTSMLPLLTNMLHTNVLWNMLLEGSSVRVLQCSPLSTDTGCRLQLLFQAVLPTRTLQLVFLSVSLPSAFKKFCSNKQGHVTGTSWIFQTHLLPERMKESHFFINTGKGIWLSYVYFGSDAALPTGAVFNSSGARLRELCQWGGTKLSQGDFLLAHYH